jgi:protocatechuate 3,4-dioxygenase beta subunit
VRRPWLLTLFLIVLTAGVVVAVAASDDSGTGAENVGDDGVAELTAPAPDRPRTTTAGAAREAGPTNCEATESNPGGTNNYIADAPERDALGEGFVIEGFVRQSSGCEPLEDMPVQVWLATETGGEQDNRATVRTDADGRYRIETPPTVPQFGEPNIHVAVDQEKLGFEPVFIRRVVDLDDRRAVINLTLARR